MKKNILIGITASIASYKIYELIRMFKKNNFDVKVVITENASKFVSPLVIETLSENKCYVNQFDSRDDIKHISLQDWADVFVVAPMSANTLSKCAVGICDNLLTSIFCAFLGSKKPILLAPAMNNFMLENPVIQKNIETLIEHNCEIVEPDFGFLACKKEAKGRLANINIIYEKTLRLLYQDKNNNLKKVIVTLGGTKEKIDSVRQITNSSSGKMGLNLSKWAYRFGYDVTVLSTIDIENAPFKIEKLESAIEMLKYLKKADFDYLIMAAAVADFRAKNPQDKKISKEKIKGDIALELVKNPDVVYEIAKNKKEYQKIIGFCLADDDVINCAKKKLENKKLDFIVANNVNIALNSNENEVTIIDKNGKITDIRLDTKEIVAKKILEEVL